MNDTCPDVLHDPPPDTRMILDGFENSSYDQCRSAISNDVVHSCIGTGCLVDVTDSTLGSDWQRVQVVADAFRRVDA